MYVHVDKFDIDLINTCLSFLLRKDSCLVHSTLCHTRVKRTLNYFRNLKIFLPGITQN